MSRVVGTDPRGVEAAGVIVQQGGVILYPTETVYGLGGDPARSEVAARIRAIKKNEVDKPLLVLTDHWERVESWFKKVTTAHRYLMAARLPLTLLFDASAEAPIAAVSDQGLIGLRRTTSRFCCALTETCGPILSTSANPSGEPAPNAFEAIDADLLQGVDLAVRNETPLAGTASTVVRVKGKYIEVLREGAVSRAEVERVAHGA